MHPILPALILSLSLAAAHEHQHFVVANQPREAATEDGVVPVDKPDKPSKVFVIEIGQPPITQKGEKPYPAGVLIYSVDATLASGKNPVVVHGRDGLEQGATYLTGHNFENQDAALKIEVGEALEGGSFNVKATITH